MKEYTVLVIDDEYEARAEIYEAFFTEPVKNLDFTFRVRPVQKSYEFQNFCSSREHVDAIFLDARLVDGWDDKENYYCVLQQMESLYTKRYTPPVFMVSKKWQTVQDLLMSVSMSISRLKKFEHPSAYYDFEVIKNIVDDVRKYQADPDKESAVTLIESIKYHRIFIRDEIQKQRAMEKVDALIVMAVTEEKTATYKVFGLEDKNDKTIADDDLVYQTVTINGKRIAFVTQGEMGLSEAARVTESSILSFEPSVVIMGGICAGDESLLNLGSIVIPRGVYDYSSGKICSDENGIPQFLQRLQSVPESSNMAAFYQFVENENNAREILAKIQNDHGGEVPESDKVKKIVTYPMASGPWVVDSKTVFELIKQKIPHDKFCSIDMEAYAFASVAAKHRLPWIVVKTVQDYANGDKTRTETTARKYAAKSSALFIKAHLDQIVDLCTGGSSN